MLLVEVIVGAAPFAHLIFGVDEGQITVYDVPVAVNIRTNPDTAFPVAGALEIVNVVTELFRFTLKTELLERSRVNAEPDIVGAEAVSTYVFKFTQLVELTLLEKVMVLDQEYWAAVLTPAEAAAQ